MLDLIWPRRCEICSRPSDRAHRHVCSECLMGIPFIDPASGCTICGRPADIGEGEMFCRECVGERKPHFDRAGSAFVFEGEARRMLLDYKFNGHVWMREDFIDWLEAVVRGRFGATSVDLVVPAPITMLHRYDRGFNQCEYLARGLAKRIDRKYDATILRRTGSPRRQAGLSAEERWLNVAGTFTVKKPELVAGRTILVVDDVMTTGATLSECAKTLKEAGAWRVFALSLSRPDE